MGCIAGIVFPSNLAAHADGRRRSLNRTPNEPLEHERGYDAQGSLRAVQRSKRPWDGMEFVEFEGGIKTLARLQQENSRGLRFRGSPPEDLEAYLHERLYPAPLGPA